MPRTRNRITLLTTALLVTAGTATGTARAAALSLSVDLTAPTHPISLTCP
ncbi:hypothetical protein AB0B89_23410 [Sphaerisporangium sp. NPDC049002]